ncbi:MAG: hypothetical protein ACK8QZ_07555 [Anaerolineales bacterium]
MHVFTDIFALALSYLALRLSALPRMTVTGVTLGWIAIEIFHES